MSLGGNSTVHKPVVQVIWRDAQDHGETWVHEDDTVKFGENVCEIVSYGLLVSKTDKYATLAGDWDESDRNYGRVTKIPTAWIVDLVELHPQSPQESVEK